MTLSSAVVDVLARFTAAGIRAVDTPADIVTPCVYLIPPDGRFRFDRGRVEIDWIAYLVVGNTGNTSAARALSALVDLVAGLASFTTFTRDAVNNPDGGDPYPAYRLSWTTTATIGDTTP